MPFKSGGRKIASGLKKRQSVELEAAPNKSTTALVVEHDPDVIKLADHVVDVGPHAGTLGGTIMSEGSYAGHLFNKGYIKV